MKSEKELFFLSTFCHCIGLRLSLLSLLIIDFIKL